MPSLPAKMESFVNARKKTLEIQKLNFPHSTLFHMKTRVSLKYFVNDYSSHSSWFKNLSESKKYLPTKLVKISVREILFPGILEICRKPESIQYTDRKLSADVFRQKYA